MTSMSPPSPLSEKIHNKEAAITLQGSRRWNNWLKQDVALTFKMSATGRASASFSLFPEKQILSIVFFFLKFFKSWAIFSYILFYDWNLSFSRIYRRLLLNQPGSCVCKNMSKSPEKQNCLPSFQSLTSNAFLLINSGESKLIITMIIRVIISTMADWR